jgi:hypothetical protein
MAKMSLKTRREVVLAKAREYRMASKKDKGKILKELCDLTGYHPKYTLVVLKKALDRLLSHEGVSLRRKRNTTTNPALLK